MGCPTEVTIGDNLTFSICCHDPDTGVVTDAGSAPSYRVYEDETPTAILTGSLAKLDDANTTGFYTETIACTTANGFESGKTYTVYIEATVDGDKGAICYGFKATTKAGFSLAAAGLDSVVVETGLNARQALSILSSSGAGVLAGAATTTVTIAAAGVAATNRITATVDSSGNRSAVTLSPPA